MQHSTSLRLAICGSTALVVIAAASIHQYLTGMNDIPLPFAQNASSSLTGDLTKIGRRVADVYKVTFPTGVNTETLTEDRIYLVYIPDETGIENKPFSDVLTLDVDGSHDVDFFGYKYVTADASIEKQNKNELLLADRFPGQFFASPKARAGDAQYGNFLANFEANNDIVMDPTNSPTGALFRKGSLYFLIVNETGNVTITVRTPAAVACGNGIKEGTEACDDGDTTGGDGCSATCTVESNFSCNRATPNVCITYNQFVKNLADTAPTNGTVSQNEALLVTLRIGDAISNQQYDAGLDINGDGVFNSIDSSAIFTELDILAPTPQE